MNPLTIAALLGGGYLAYQSLGNLNAAQAVAAVTPSGLPRDESQANMQRINQAQSDAFRRNAAFYGIGGAALLGLGAYRLARGR